MTQAQLRTILRRLIRNRDVTVISDAALDVALNDAYYRLCSGRFRDRDRTQRDVLLYFPELIIVGAHVFSENYYGPEVHPLITNKFWVYPAEAQVIIDVSIKSPTVPARSLKRIPLERVYKYEGDVGVPLYYTAPEWIRRIYPMPTPETTEDIYINGTAYITYYRKPDPMSEDGPIIGEPYHSLIALLAGRDLSQEFGEDERAESLAQMFYARLNEIAPARWLSSAFKSLDLNVARG